MKPDWRNTLCPSKTLREVAGLGHTPTTIGKSALILIDCQNTYREGIMQLEGVEPALVECQTLLKRFRDAGRPVIHIQHDAGPGSPYDVHGRSGAIADVVAPRPGEPVVVKAYPSSFEKTNLDELLKGYGVKDLTLAGFMTHVCVNSTARAAFNLGYNTTVIADATATRSLPSPMGGVVPANELHNASLAALHDFFAVVVPSSESVSA
jgi:nicotinamidase-related amidase